MKELVISMAALVTAPALVRVMWNRRGDAAGKVLASVISSALLAIGFVALLPPHRASASTTYTWNGLDTLDPHAWGRPKNWEPEGNPQDGDSVVISGNTTITGVPTITLVSFQVKGDEMPGTVGPTLKGALGTTITTNLLIWGRSRIQVSLVVNGSAQLTNFVAPGPVLDNGATALGSPPVTFTNNGVVTQFGTFGLSPGPGSGARLVNNGTWLAPLDAKVDSGECCGASTGVIDNHGTFSLGGRLVLDHARFLAEPNSSVNGSGTLEILGGLATMTGPWSIAGGTKLDLTSNSIVNIGGTTNVGGEFIQDNSSQILGTGTFAGTGKYRWLGGRILGNLTLGPDLTGTIEGPTPPVRELSSDLGSGVLTVEGTVLQTSDVLMNGEIVNKGLWRAMAPAANVTIGAGGLGTPPKKFRNEGTIEVSGTKLSLSLLELSNPPGKGVITGGGTLQLSGGIHQFHDGAAIKGRNTRVEVTGAAEVHADGTLNLDRARLVVDHAQVWDTFKIDGTGTTSWLSASIVGDLTTGANVDVRFPAGTGAIALDGATGLGILHTNGDVQQNRADPISLISDAHIINSGTWLMQQATFSGTVCCATPATFENDGELTIRGSTNPAAKFSLMQFVNTGRMVVDDTIEFATLSPRQKDGSIELKSGRVTTDQTLLISGGLVFGNGTIQGSVKNAARVDPGHGPDTGLMTVARLYRQTSKGTLLIDLKGGSKDLLGADETELAGTIAFDGFGSDPLTRSDKIVVLSSNPLVGRFESVEGLKALGSGWHVRYMATEVKLVHI